MHFQACGKSLRECVLCEQTGFASGCGSFIVRKCSFHSSRADAYVNDLPHRPFVCQSSGRLKKPQVLCSSGIRSVLLSPTAESCVFLLLYFIVV